jgi:translation initiation factor 3 subunit K
MSSEKPPREYVESLVSKGAYKTSNKTTYEEYVNAQIAGEGEYYFEANKALLKIYQFLPQSMDMSKVASVLLLSILQYSTRTTDFLALSYMVPDRIQKTEPIASIIQCHTLLEGCQFVEFWEKFTKLSQQDDGLKSFVGSTKTKETLQRSTLQALALTYKSISVDKVLKFVNMKDGSELTQLNDPCIESVTDKTVTFISTPDNTKRNRVFQEGVSYGALANLMSKVAAAE